jgi:O-antigen ligase
MPLARAAECSEATRARRNRQTHKMSTVTGQDERAPSALYRFASDRIARQIAAGCEVGLDAAAVPFFPLLVLAPRGVVPLVSVAGLCAAGLVLSASGRRPRPALALTATLLGCMLVWGTASAFWSVDPLRSLVIAARLTGLFAVGLALTDAAGCVRAPHRLTFLLLTGLALGVAMAAIDLVTHGALGAPFTERAYQPAALNRASVSFAILLLPASAVLICRGRAVFALIMATTTATTIGALAGTAAKTALIAGLAIGLLLYLSPVRVARIAAVVSAVIIITAPLTFARFAQLPLLTETADDVKLSAGHRLLIWSFAGDRIAERPLAGWGLDASRAIPGGKDPIRPGQTWMPLHPHNTPLQLWLELGVPGAVLFALVVALSWCALAPVVWPRLFASAAGGSLMAALVASFASYGIWEEWWLGTLSFSLFVIIVMARVARHTVMSAGNVQPRTFAERLN